MTESTPATPREFLFLDTWAVCDFARGNIANNLSNLVTELELTILVDSYTLIELYNPGWVGLPFIGRTRAAYEFLMDHPSCIVNPHHLLLEEVRVFPSRLTQIPLASDLHSVHWSVRDYLLRGLFRRDKELLLHGIDLQAWANDYELSKKRWHGTVQTILDHASAAGLLRRDRHGEIDPGASDKESFLRYLDRRFLKFEHHKDLQPQQLLDLAANVRDLIYGGTAQLPAVRLTSLGFWHAYIQGDRAFPTPIKGSDLGDLHRFALIPYCAYFTVDSAMGRVLKRVLTDFPQSATILGRSDLNNLLATYAPDPGAFLRY